MHYKPITVQYGGYRFRSKLEAKWAVFLDYLRVPYQYEPRVYHLHGNIGYLPDFYLPEQDIFLEIKPDKDLREADARKIQLFSTDNTIKPNLIVVFGEPDLFQDRMFFVRGCNWQGVRWAYNEEQDIAKIQTREGTWGDPRHPIIYGAVEHSLGFHHQEILDK